MITWYVDENLSEPNMPLSMVLDGVPATTEATESVAVDVFFRYTNDPTMEPKFLGKGVAGKALDVPIDTKGSEVELSMISFTREGQPSALSLEKAVKLIVPPPACAELASAVYDDGPNEVTLTIANNRGQGTIRILRKVGSADFSEIATVDFDETEYVDDPPVDGEYSYKLTQDRQPGESATKTVTVDDAGTAVGSPPSALVAVYDDVETVALGWANNGGTDSNVIERKEGVAGIYADLVTLSSSATSYNDTVLQTNKNRTLYYRVKNPSTPGYSNEADVFIPRML